MPDETNEKVKHFQTKFFVEADPIQLEENLNNWFQNIDQQGPADIYDIKQFSQCDKLIIVVFYSQ